MDNPHAAMKNSLLRGRNTEQCQILEMSHIRDILMRKFGSFFKLFGITVSKDLRQFHDCMGITHRPWVVTLFSIWFLARLSWLKASDYTAQ